MDISKTDLQTAARLLLEAATYLQARARSAREADKARQMMKLSKKLGKKLTSPSAGPAEGTQMQARPACETPHKDSPQLPAR